MTATTTPRRGRGDDGIDHDLDARRHADRDVRRLVRRHHVDRVQRAPPARRRRRPGRPGRRHRPRHRRVPAAAASVSSTRRSPNSEPSPASPSQDIDDLLTGYQIDATASQIVVVLEGEVDVGLLRIFDVDDDPIQVRVTAVGYPHEEMPMTRTQHPRLSLAVSRPVAVLSVGCSDDDTAADPSTAPTDAATTAESTATTDSATTTSAPAATTTPASTTADPTTAPTTPPTTPPTRSPPTTGRPSSRSSIVGAVELYAAPDLSRIGEYCAPATDCARGLGDTARRRHRQGPAHRGTATVRRHRDRPGVGQRAGPGRARRERGVRHRAREPAAGPAGRRRRERHR